jgi:hypothetical protein
MKEIFLCAMLQWGLSLPQACSQSGPETFPLAGDWDGVWAMPGSIHRLVLHLNTTPEGKMTALLDDTDDKTCGAPPISGSLDGNRLILRFTYWMPNGNRDLEPRVASYVGAVNESNSAMTGVWTQEGSWPVNFKRMTWQVKIPNPAPPTVFDGDWAGVEYEGGGRTIHFIFHIHNTEDGLSVLIDVPDEKVKGALACKVSNNQASRQLSFTSGYAFFTGKMTADGKGMDTSMTEPTEHYLIHFDRVAPKTTEPK